jgi:hypothetical protein
MMATTPLGEPSDVQITVLRLPDDGALRRRVESHLARLQTLAVAAFVVAIAGVMFAAVLGIGRPPRASAAGVGDPGPAGVAAAYGYPPSCLDVTIAAVNPAFARADFHRSGACELYSGFPSALFHRFGEQWHPVLYAVSYPCPLQSVPPTVQRQLKLCPTGMT